jgi:hypothetical protein
MGACSCQLVLESPATVASDSRLYCLAYRGSRAAILAIHRSLDRSAASNNSGGDRRHRNCAICAMATSVRIKYRSTHPHFDKRQRYFRCGCFRVTSLAIPISTGSCAMRRQDDDCGHSNKKPAGHQDPAP